MNVAVVDIGSNSTRLLIAARTRDAITELVRHSNVTRLGAGVDREGRLAEDAMQRVHAVLDGYRAEIAAHDCESAVAVLTSAVRDSANGDEFADRHPRPLRPPGACAQRRRGGAAHLPRRDERARPGRPHADARARHRRRLDRDGDRRGRRDALPRLHPGRGGAPVRAPHRSRSADPARARRGGPGRRRDPRRRGPSRRARPRPARDRGRRHRDVAGGDRAVARPL